MRRYLGLLATAVRASLLGKLQYRVDFIAQGAMQIAWLVLSALPLWIAYRARASAVGAPMSAVDIGGYGFYAAAVVFSFFLLLKAVLDGAINPSLSAVVEHIRQGTLDFLLLKPADAQFLVSTARFEPWRLVDALGALALLIFAAVRHSQAGGHPLPGVGHLLTAAVLFVCSVLLLYSVWILVICAAFYVVKIDNLSFLFTSIFDFARWPRSVFTGFLHVLFTYIIPLAVMTSFPADALLSGLGLREGVWAVLFTAVLLTLSRLVWLRAIARYTSASS
jgi:ABC-2 type transport system permease protein